MPIEDNVARIARQKRMYFGLALHGIITVAYGYMNWVVLDHWRMHYGTLLPIIQAEPEMRHLSNRIPVLTLFLIDNRWIGIVFPFVLLSLLCFTNHYRWNIASFLLLEAMLAFQVLLVLLPALPMI